MKRHLREVFRCFNRNALKLLERMLTLDPSQRICAKDALDAEYFWTDPLPCDPKRFAWIYVQFGNSNIFLILSIIYVSFWFSLPKYESSRVPNQEKAPATATTQRKC